MGKKVTYNGKTFTFSDNVTDEQIATALKGYEEGLAKDVKKKESSQESILPTKNTTGTTGSPSRSNSLGDLEMAGDPANTPVQKKESPKGLFSLFKSIFTSNDGSEETKQTGKRKQANTDNRTGGQSKVVNPVNSLGDVEPLVEIEKEIALPQSNIINGRAKKEDIDKLKQFAPDRYKELEGLVNGNPLAQTDIVAATNSYFIEQKKLSNRINSQKQTVSSYNRASGLGFDFSKGNNEGYVAGLTGNLKRQMDAEISSIDKAYPQKYEVSGAFPGASFPVRDFEKEARIAQVRAKYQNMQNDIGRVHAIETTKDYKDNDKAEVVGERYAKIADPETYSLYLQSGKRSPKAAAKIVKYGMDILNGTANENDAKIADLTESTFNTLHPQEEKERIYHILGAEYYKTKQSNWLLTRPPSIKELDDIASKVLTEDELEFYKSHNRVEEKNRIFGTNVPLSGAINKLGENALTTLASTGATYLDWGQIRGREDQAYDALEGQPISMQNVGEDSGMKSRLNELKKKPVKTFDDIQEINRLNKFVDVKSDVSEFLDNSFGVAGQVLAIAGGSKGIGAFSKGVGIANTADKLIKAEKAAAAWLGYAQTYDAARQDLLRLNPKASETELTMYGGYIGIINAASENIFRDAKVLEAFNRTVAPDAIKIFNQLNKKGIAETSKNELYGKLGKLLLNSKEFGEAYLKNNGQEVTEEVATQIGTSIADYFAAPEKFGINEELGKVKATAYDMAVSGILIAIPGGMSDYNKRRDSRVTIPMLNRLGYDASLRHDVKDIINEQEKSGIISPQVAAEKHAIVNTLEDIHNTTIRVSNEIRPLEKHENEKITALALQKRLADEKIKSGKYDDFKETYQKISDNAKAEINKIVGKELVVDGDYNTMTVDEYNKANPPVEPTGATTNQAQAEANQIDVNQLQLDKEKELVDNIESKTKAPSLASETEEQPSVESAVIEIGGKTYEGKNHAEAILSAKADGQDISQVDRQAQGKFKLSDGTIIDRSEAKTRFGQDRSELLIPQDENSKRANLEYAKETSAVEPQAEGKFNYKPGINKVLGTPEIEIEANGEKIGQLRTYTSESNPNLLITNGIEVGNDFRGQGAAKGAYIELAKQNPDKTIQSSGQITEGSKGVWESLVKDGIAQKIGENKYEMKPFSQNQENGIEQQPKSTTQSEIELKNEGKADAPTLENIDSRLRLGHPFYEKVSDALDKLGLIKKYNPETKEGDIIGGFSQKTSDGGFQVGKIQFKKDGSIVYIDGFNLIDFDKNGNVISENTKEAKAQETQNTIKSLKESIISFENLRDSEAFKYKEITQISPLGDKTKIKVLKTEQELKASTDKINAQIDKSKAELRALEQTTPQSESKPALRDVESTAKALEGKIKREANVVNDGDDLILKHGTPHDFTKFQLEKIGTGEGQQAFGYGLYFTDGSKIAEQYAKKLSEDKTGLVYEVRVKDGVKKEWVEWREPLEQDVEDKLYNALTNEEKTQYQEYLDKSNWDNDHVGKFDELQRDEYGIETYDKPSAVGLIYRDLKDAFGQQKATEIFKRAGIDGIKYRSNAGRGDNFNYVVFDPNSIEIIKKEKPYLSGNPQKISEAYHKAKADGSNPELIKAVESLLSKEQTPALSDVVGKTFRDNYNRTFEVKGENAGILTLEDVDTGKVLRKKKSEVLSDFKEITEPDVVDMAKTITDHLPKGGELKGITEVKVSDNGEEVSYGTKTSKTSISVKGLSAEDIKQEIEFEKKVLAKSKRDVENFNEDEIRSAKGLTRQEKEDAIKMHKQSLINNEQTEKIVIPFYEKHLESLLSKEQTPQEVKSKSEIEAKKADIEKRRQEALFGNITPLEFETTDTKGRTRKTIVKTKVDENGFQYSFETTIDGKSSSTAHPKVTKQEFINSSIYKNLDQNSKEFIDELPEDAVILLQSIAISTDKNSAAGLGNGNITIGYVSKELGGRVDDIALKYQPNKINAKYDAELKALEQQSTSTTQSETAQENDNTNTDSIQVLENEKQSKIDKVNNSKLGEVAKKAQIKRIEAEYADAIGYVNTKSEPINGSPSDNTKKSLNEEGANIGNNAIKNKSSENGENNEAQQTEGQKDVLNENESVGDGNTKPTSFLQELTGNNESVTVSGLTEDARQKQIAKRNKELTLSPEEMVENDLAMMVQTFNDLPNGRLGKGKSDGARLLNKIKNLAKGGKFLIEGGGAAKNIVIKKRLKNGKLGKITLRQKDTGRRSIVPNGKALHERGESFQREFMRLMDMNLPFDFRNTDGSMFSESQFNSALDDIYNGIPSENAEYVLNHVEKSVETGEIEFGSKSNGYGVIKLDDAIAELESIVEEDMFKNMTDEEIIAMYANELERIALQEDEQTRFEIEQENLINQEHEQVNNGGAVQKPSSEEQEISNQEGGIIPSETGSETEVDEKEKVDSGSLTEQVSNEKGFWTDFNSLKGQYTGIGSIVVFDNKTYRIDKDVQMGKSENTKKYYLVPIDEMGVDTNASEGSGVVGDVNEGNKRALQNAAKIEDGNGSHVIKMTMQELQELASDMVANEKEYQDKFNDAQGIYNLTIERIEELEIEQYQQKEDKAKSFGDESMSDNYVQVMSEDDFLIEHIERYYGKVKEQLSKKQLADAEEYTKNNFKGEGYYNDTMDDFIGDYNDALRSFWGESKSLLSKEQPESVNQSGTKIKAFRLEGLNTDKLGNDFKFYGTEDVTRDFYSEYETDNNKIKQHEISFTNPLTVELDNNQFSDPKHEAPYLKKAKEEGNDAVVFINKDRPEDIFYAILQKADTQAKKQQNNNTKVEKRNARYSGLKNEIDDAWKDFLGDSGLFTSGGLDPKKIETGTKLIGLYIKQGVYKFSDIAQDAYARFGDKLAEIMDELKAVYSAYYNTTTDEIAMQMDSNVRGISYEKIVSEIEIKETPKEVFTKAIQDRIENGEKLNIIQLRKTANDVGYKYNSDTELQEHTEVAIINLAKAITEESISQDEKFNKIVSLYESQPTISMRSADRIANQQYSTPIPMSFVAGEFINQITPKTILEPSAGNGMMIFNTNHSNVIVNEIDKVRLSNLENKGYKLVTNHDALKPFNIGKVDAVIMNPPFGKSEQQLYGDAYRISGLDPQMVINALNSMKDDGRAAIIIGGHNEYEENGALKKDKAFLNYLYNYYNVSDIINVAGDLYSKQGTSFPTRMIFINGRRMDTSVRRFAPLGTEVNSEAVKTFDDLYNRVKSIQDETIPYTGIPDSNIDGNEQPNNVDGTDNTRGSQKANTTIRKRQRKSDSNIGGLFGNEQFEQRSGTTGSNNEQPSSIEPSKSGSGEEISKGESKPVSRSVPRENPVLIPGRVIGTPRTIDETKEKTEYIPQSNSGKIGSVVPTNMASPLESILSQFGDIDGYVMDRLQYPNKEGLYQALAAEQVDSVALGIYQIENGNALIIGDQTGVGKGRQAAAFIRYGVLNGYKPIFLTEKPHLFSDIYRDMRDIGSGKMNPFIINDKSADSDPSMTDENGAVIYKPLSAASKKSIYAKGEIPNGYDYAVVTYSQLSGSIDKPSAKKEFFASIASNNIIIADESHNAGGAGNTGQFLQNVVPTTKGMVFLSGTFAKRPDNMPIYALKTGMSDANMSSDEMVEAIQKGGVPLQEIMSKGLVDLGQMIRRERDFTGVNIDWETLSNSKESHSKTFDSVIDIFNDLIHFQRNHITPIVEQLNEMLKAEHGVAEKTKGTTDLGISNTPFASKTFNLVRQLLLSLKAEDVAKETIAELKAGRKPVIAIANTMESFLKDMNIQEGDVLGNVDYSLTLKKGLDGLFRYTEKDFSGNPVYKYLSVNDLSEEGKTIYNDLVSKIKEASSGITISPIDVIKKRIKQAGYTVGEMTGRDIELDIQDDGGAIVNKRTDKNKKKLSRDFNSGELDVLIINQSGSTGISLHASEKFKDKRQRVMLSAQTQLDVNTEIQLRGRIDRTGQLVRGAYRYIISPIPAEQRLIMMFKAKLKSLDANTTSSQKSKTNEIEVVDFLNKYGDEIVTEYLKENRNINDKLLDPLGLDSMSDEGIDELEKVDGASSKVSGRVALLNVVEQEAFYNEVSERYTAHLKYLEDNNANDLEIKVLPLEAATRDKKVIVAGSNNGNPFSENSWLETVEINVLRKPMTQAEIKGEMATYMDGKDNQGYKADNISKIEKYFDEQIVTEADKITEDYKRKEKRITDVARNEAIKAGVDVDQYVKEAISKLNEARDFRIQMSNAKRNNIKSNVTRVINGLNTGKSYLVPNSVNIGTDTTYSDGIFIGLKMKAKLTPSNITAVFATLDGRRKVEVPLSKTQYLNAVIGQSNLGFSQVNLENWDTKTSNKTRRTAHILTGNILQAFAVNKGGQLVTFTTKDGGLRQGILMPENYNPESQKTRVQLIAGLSKLEDGISLLDTSREVEVIPVRGDYELRVPLSRKQGGKYFLDDNLRDLVKNRAFNQVGNRMVAEVSSNRISDVLQYLSVHHNTSIEIDAKELDENTAKYQAETNSDNTVVAEYGTNFQKGVNTDGQAYLSLSDGDYENTNVGNKNNVETVWRESKHLDFTSPIKVKSHKDVAEIFKLLEDASVEHGYAVHIDAKGDHHIQFLSIGSNVSTIIDAKAILQGVNKFGTKKLYLVHNHPSGNITPSNVDLKITDIVRKLLGNINVGVEHVIMDTYKMEYTHLDSSNSVLQYKRDEYKTTKRIKAFIADGQKILEEPVVKVNSANDVFEYIQQLHHTALPKNAMLVLDNSNNVVGNYILQEINDYTEIFKAIGESATGRRVIFYGNQNNIDEVNEVKAELGKVSIDVLDYVVNSSNGKGVKGMYESMASEGLLREHQNEYGTNYPNQVNEPSAKETAFADYKTALEEYKKDSSFDNELALVDAYETAVNTDKKQSEKLEVPEAIKETADEILNSVADKDNMAVPPVGTTGMGSTNPADENSIVHGVTANIREQLGLPEYDKKVLTDEEVESLANKAIQKGYDVYKLIARLGKTKSPPTTVEQKILSKYVYSLKEEIETNPTNEALDKLNKAMNVIEYGRTEAGRLLREGKNEIYITDSLASYLLQEQQSNSVDELTEAQIKKVTKEYEDIKKANDKLQAKIEKLQEELSKKKAERVVKEQQGGAKVTKDFEKERNNIYTSIREKLRAARGNMYSSPVPYLNEILAITPDVARLVKSYVEEGITKLDVIVKNIHDLIKEDSSNITEKDIVDIIAGKYNTKKATKTELQQQLNDLKVEANLVSKLDDLQSGEIPSKENDRVERNKRISELRKQIREEDLYRLQSAKNRLKNEINKLQKDLDEGNFTKEKAEDIVLDQEAIDLKDELIRLKKERAIRLLREEYNNRTKSQKALDMTLEVINVPRTIMASMDFSAPLRQGIVQTVAHPIIAARAMGEMFKQAVSQKRFDRWFYDVQESPLYPLIQESGLYIADPHDLRLSVKEEQFMNNLAEKIPLVGKFIKGSERAYVLFLNKMRHDLFVRGVEVMQAQGKTFNTSENEYKGLASFINNSTGRGKIGFLEPAAPILNSVFFSPRLIASRLNLLNPVYYAKLPSNIRKMAIGDMAKFISFGAALLGLAALAWGCDDDCVECEDCIKVETDPRSSDFAKLKIGNTRYDIWGGFQQYVRLASQLFTGEAKSSTTGRVNKIDGEGLFGKDRADVTGSFFRGKLAPVPATILDVVAGRNIIGEKVTPGMIAERSLLPLIYSDVKEAYNEQGAVSILTVGLPAAFGIGVNTYDPKVEKKSKAAYELEDIKGVGEKSAEKLLEKQIDKAKLSAMSAEAIANLKDNGGDKIFDRRTAYGIKNKLDGIGQGENKVSDMPLEDAEKKYLSDLGVDGVDAKNVKVVLSQLKILRVKTEDKEAKKKYLNIIKEVSKYE